VECQRLTAKTRSGDEIEKSFMKEILRVENLHKSFGSNEVLLSELQHKTVRSFSERC
jgi:hypothetical protein